MTDKQKAEQLRARADRFHHSASKSDGTMQEDDRLAYESMIAAAEALEAGGITTQEQLDKNPLPIGGTKGNRRGFTFIDGDGRRVQAVGPDEKIFDETAYSGPRVGEMICGMVTGNYGQFAGQITADPAKGGVMLSSDVSSMFIDLARSASVVVKAGAQTIPMGAVDSLAIARLTQDPTAQWRHETAPINASIAKFAARYLRPRVLACLVPISVELAEDAPNAVMEIERAIAAAIGLELDRTALFGAADAAGNRPTAASTIGVFNEEGINSVAAVGTPGDYVDISTAVRKILEANYAGELSGLSWIAHPRDWFTYDGLTDQHDQPLQPTPWASELRRMATTSMPTNGGGGSESQMIVGDFSEVVIGMRTSGIKIEVFDQGSAKDEDGNEISAMAQMMKWIRAYIRVDSCTLRPQFFSKLTGVTAA